MGNRRPSIDFIHHIQYGKGQDLIFLHGWGGDCYSLAGLAAPLTSEFRVTLVDFYGFGKTPHPDFPLTLDDYVQSVIRLINHYKMTQVVLIGHSFGGRVAMLLAARYGHLIDGVVLIDAAGMKPRRTLRYRINRVKRYFALHWHIGKAPAGSKDYNALQGNMRRTFVNIVNTHLEKYLPYITMPVLMIWGGKDRETPLYFAKKIKRRVRRAELAVFKNAGHFPYLEHRAECTALLKNFLGG